MFYSRTFSWMLLWPTAELLSSWWRGRNTVRSDNCSNVSVSQAWQPKVTETPSSSTAWKLSREFHPRCAHSHTSWLVHLLQCLHIPLFIFLFTVMYLKLYKIPLSFWPFVIMASPFPGKKLHGENLYTQNMALSMFLVLFAPGRCLWANRVELLPVI